MHQLTLAYSICFILQLPIILNAEKISDYRLCADRNCQTLISTARALARYKPIDPAFLAFERGEVISVYSKSAGNRQDLWGGEINGRKGYFPRSFVRENKVEIPNPQIVVETEPHLTIEEKILGKTQPAKQQENKPPPVQQSDPSTSNQQQTESTPPPAQEPDPQANSQQQIEPPRQPESRPPPTPRTVKQPIHHANSQPEQNQRSTIHEVESNKKKSGENEQPKPDNKPPASAEVDETEIGDETELADSETELPDTEEESEKEELETTEQIQEQIGVEKVEQTVDDTNDQVKDNIEVATEEKQDTGKGIPSETRDAGETDGSKEVEDVQTDGGTEVDETDIGDETEIGEDSSETDVQEDETESQAAPDSDGKLDTTTEETDTDSTADATRETVDGNEDTVEETRKITEKLEDEIVESTKQTVDDTEEPSTTVDETAKVEEIDETELGGEEDEGTVFGSLWSDGGEGKGTEEISPNTDRVENNNAYDVIDSNNENNTEGDRMVNTGINKGSLPESLNAEVSETVEKQGIPNNKEQVLEHSEQMLDHVTSPSDAADIEIEDADIVNTEKKNPDVVKMEVTGSSEREKMMESEESVMRNLNEENLKSFTPQEKITTESPLSDNSKAASELNTEYDPDNVRKANKVDESEDFVPNDNKEKTGDSHLKDILKSSLPEDEDVHQYLMEHSDPEPGTVIIDDDPFLSGKFVDRHPVTDSEFADKSSKSVETENDEDQLNIGASKKLDSTGQSNKIVFNSADNHVFNSADDILPHSDIINGTKEKHDNNDMLRSITKDQNVVESVKSAEDAAGDVLDQNPDNLSSTDDKSFEENVISNIETKFNNDHMHDSASKQEESNMGKVNEDKGELAHETAENAGNKNTVGTETDFNIVQKTIDSVETTEKDDNINNVDLTDKNIGAAVREDSKPIENQADSSKGSDINIEQKLPSGRHEDVGIEEQIRQAGSDSEESSTQHITDSGNEQMTNIKRFNETSNKEIDLDIKVSKDTGTDDRDQLSDGGVAAIDTSVRPEDILVVEAVTSPFKKKEEEPDPETEVEQDTEAEPDTQSESKDKEIPVKQEEVKVQDSEVVSETDKKEQENEKLPAEQKETDTETRSQSQEAQTEQAETEVEDKTKEEELDKFEKVFKVMAEEKAKGTSLDSTENDLKFVDEKGEEIPDDDEVKIEQRENAKDVFVDEMEIESAKEGAESSDDNKTGDESKQEDKTEQQIDEEKQQKTEKVVSSTVPIQATPVIDSSASQPEGIYKETSEGTKFTRQQTDSYKDVANKQNTIGQVTETLDTKPSEDSVMKSTVIDGTTLNDDFIAQSTSSVYESQQSNAKKFTVIDGTTFYDDYNDDVPTTNLEQATPVVLRTETVTDEIHVPVHSVTPTTSYIMSEDMQKTRSPEMPEQIKTNQHAAQTSLPVLNENKQQNFAEPSSVSEQKEIDASTRAKSEVNVKENLGKDNIEALGTSFNVVSQSMKETTTIPLDTETIVIKTETARNNETVASNNVQELVQPSLDQDVYKTDVFLSRKILSSEPETKFQGHEVKTEYQQGHEDKHVGHHGHSHEGSHGVHHGHSHEGSHGGHHGHSHEGSHGGHHGHSHEGSHGVHHGHSHEGSHGVHHGHSHDIKTGYQQGQDHEDKHEGGHGHSHDIKTGYQQGQGHDDKHLGHHGHSHEGSHVHHGHSHDIKTGYQQVQGHDNKHGDHQDPIHAQQTQPEEKEEQLDLNNNAWTDFGNEKPTYDSLFQSDSDTSGSEDRVSGRKVPDPLLDEEIIQPSEPLLKRLDPYLKSLINMLPPSLQSMLEQEPLGLSPGLTMLVSMISTNILAVLTCLGCVCKGKSKPKGKKDPLEVIQGLEEKLFITTKEKENLEDDLQVKNKKITELEQEVNNQQSTTGTVETDLKTIRLHNEALKKQVSKLEEELEEVKDEAQEQARVAAQRESEIQEYSADVESLTQRAQDAELALQKTSQRLSEKEEDLRNSLAQVQTMSEQMQHLQTRKQQLQDEAVEWSEKVKDLSERVEQFSEEAKRMQEDLAFKENELEVLRDCFLQVKAFQGEDEMKEEAEQSPDLTEKLKQMMDVSRVNASLRAVEEERDVIQNKLLIEVESRKELEDQVQMLKRKFETNQTDKMKAERQCQEAQTKLEVLSKYFKEKEAELTRQLGEQEVLKNQNMSKLQSTDSITQELKKENEIYRQTIEDLKTEITKAERDFRSQIAANEKKAHENWLATRAAERELKESRHECGMLRQKLTDLERKLMMGPPPGLIRPITHRPMPPPGMMNGPPPPPPDRPGSRGSVHGHVTPRLRDEDYRDLPPPPDRRGPPPGPMGPMGPRPPPPHLEAMSPPPFAIRPPFPPDRRSPPPFDRYPSPRGPRPPFPRPPPPHLRSPSTMGSGNSEHDDSRQGQVSPYNRGPQGSRDRDRGSTRHQSQV